MVRSICVIKAAKLDGGRKLERRGGTAAAVGEDETYELYFGRGKGGRGRESHKKSGRIISVLAITSSLSAASRATIDTNKSAEFNDIPSWRVS